jgi:hypothetical protein
MARSFGVLTSGKAGFTASLLQSVRENTTAEIAEARDSIGKVTDQKAYSIEATGELEAILDSSDTLPGAGTSVTVGAVTGLITSVGSEETNTGYKSCNVAVSKKDAATQVAYS